MMIQRASQLVGKRITPTADAQDWVRELFQQPIQAARTVDYDSRWVITIGNYGFRVDAKGNVGIFLGEPYCGVILFDSNKALEDGL